MLQQTGDRGPILQQDRGPILQQDRGPILQQNRELGVKTTARQGTGVQYYGKTGANTRARQGTGGQGDEEINTCMSITRVYPSSSRFVFVKD